MRKLTKMWTQKNGVKVRICDMSDQHLINTIKLVERKCNQDYYDALNSAYKFSSTLNGDVAIQHIENEIEYLEDKGPDPYEYCRLYEDLTAELYRRGLKKQ